ncbi:MAG: hypothetical protein ABEJ99_00185 [Candidatus Nanohaloarchaea archaeon]
MSYQKIQRDDGVEIKVETKEKVAVVVKGDEERIYLPDVDGDDSSYYLEEPERLLKTEYGYRVIHRGTVKEVKVL